MDGVRARMAASRPEERCRPRYRGPRAPRPRISCSEISKSVPSTRESGAVTPHPFSIKSGLVWILGILENQVKEAFRGSFGLPRGGEPHPRDAFRAARNPSFVHNTWREFTSNRIPSATE